MFGRGNQKYPIPATLLKLKEMNEQIVHELEVELDDILEIDMDYDLTIKTPNLHTAAIRWM